MIGKIAGVAGVLVSLACGPSKAETAGEVSGWCAAYDNAIELEDHRIVAPQNAAADFCWGAFVALQELMVVSENQTSKIPLLGFCAPEKGNRLELVHVFRHYMREHPEQEHEQFGRVLVVSMRATFPCK
jgi:hypothetical protein